MLKEQVERKAGDRELCIKYYCNRCDGVRDSWHYGTEIFIREDAAGRVTAFDDGTVGLIPIWPGRTFSGPGISDDAAREYLLQALLLCPHMGEDLPHGVGPAPGLDEIRDVEVVQYVQVPAGRDLAPEQDGGAGGPRARLRLPYQEREYQAGLAAAQSARAGANGHTVGKRRAITEGHTGGNGRGMDGTRGRRRSAHSQRELAGARR